MAQWIIERWRIAMTQESLLNAVAVSSAHTGSLSNCAREVLPATQETARFPRTLRLASVEEVKYPRA